MLVYDKPRAHWLKLVFSLRGSAFMRIKYRLLAVFMTAMALTWAQELDAVHFPLSTTPFSFIGLALGIFLGFRNNTSYDRFWEGRKLWGRLVNTTRTLSRQILAFVPDALAPEQRLQIYRLIAYVHALRLHLRGGATPVALAPWLEADDRTRIAAALNLPNAILLEMSRGFKRLSTAERLSEYLQVELERRLLELSDIQGGCERIKSTPIPHSYTILIHRIVAIYVFALPFGLVDTLHWRTPVVVLMVAYTFLGLDAVGEEIEDPFGEDLNDLPLDTLAKMIEINLRQTLGETDVPGPARPIDGLLS